MLAVLAACTLVPFVDDRPLECERYRFPSAAVCEEALQANRRFRLHLAGLADWGPVNWIAWEQAQGETQRLYQIWDWALAAAGGYDGRYPARGCLKELRDRLGHDAFYAGRMPSPLPLEFFRWAN